jgi:DNA (cytosine-5)-methyltransferase 1
MLNGLDLFSGIEGMSLALRDYVRPIAYCEIDAYCQGVLLSQMEENSILRAPIWDDIRSLDGRENFGDCVDIIYGGFPCQDISVAGHGKGLAGERSGLYWEIHRLAKEIKPAFIFLENVPAILCRGGSTVVESLAEMGYDCRWCVISAASVGALHRRERWFLLGYAKHNGSSAGEVGKRNGEEFISRRFEKPSTTPQEKVGQLEGTGCLSSILAHTSSPRLEGQRNGTSCTGEAHSKLAGSSENASDTPSLRRNEGASEGIHPERRTILNAQPAYAGCETVEQWREAVSSVRRTTDGVSCRMERIKSLGNSVVPIQAKTAFETLMGLI